MAIPQSNCTTKLALEFNIFIAVYLAVSFP